MESRIIIRTATPEDADDIRAIYMPYVTDTSVTFERDVPSVEEFRARISNTLATYPYLVAENDGTVVGYAYAGRFRPRKSYDSSVELSIYIRNDRLRQGIGHLLYSELERILASMNIRLMVACISYSDDQENASREFHESMGFRESGLIRKAGVKFDAWHDLLYMTKQIGSDEIPDHLIPFPDIE